MATFVRKNVIALAVEFFQPNTQTPVVAQPTGVTVTLAFHNTSGVEATTTIQLSFDAATLIWSATWDSSAAKAGRVEWMVFSSGPTQCATEGFFTIAANRANIT